MMKKVLYGVALALLACGPVCTLQSCKDDVSDLKTQTSYDLKQLQKDLNDRADDLQRQITANKNAIDKNIVDIANNANGIANNAAAIKALQDAFGALDEYAKVTWVKGQLDDLLKKMTEEDGKLQNAINNTNAQLNLTNTKVSELDAEQQRMLAQITTILGDITNLQNADIALGNRIDALKTDYDNLNLVVEGHTTQLNDHEARIAALEARAEANDASVEEINDAIAEIKTRLTEVEGRLTNAEGRLDLAEAAIENIRTQIEANSSSLNEVKEELMNLKAALGLADVEGLETRMSKIETTMAEITGRIDSLISSILVQATDSPVFGNFSLPLGVKSTVLFNWYGENKTTIAEFPSAYDTYDAGATDDESGILFNAFNGMKTVAVNDGIIDNVNLGRVYMTINPAGHSFNPNNFSLETSKGESSRLPVTFVPEKSDEELYFGYTRGEGDETVKGNGFYAADVMLTSEAGVVATRIQIDDNLKAAVKDVLKDRSKRNAIDLLKAVYGQIHHMLPAYGIRYDWTSGANSYSVLSNYELAIATAKPLSYNFYKDGSISKKLPTFGNIDNIINNFKGKFQIEFTPISFENVKIQLPALTLGTVNVRPGQTTIHKNIGKIKIEVDGEIHESQDIEFDIDVNDVVGSITSQFNEAINDMTGKIEKWNKDANKKITEDLQAQLQPIADQINGMVGDINEQIDNMIGDIAGQAQPWFDRLNKVVDLYNRFANKVNNVLEDPNHYLQVAMFYNQADSNIGILSNNIASPTPFKGNGNIGLYASSYSGEIVCPAYKKYVAVTNVYAPSDLTKPVDNAAELRDKANSAAKYFNEVMDGNTIRYAAPASAFQSGLIYEIVYQGLDYSGVTSTQKFYITVN